MSAAPGCLDTGAARQAGGIRPAVPAADLARAAKALQWRKARGYTRRELSLLTGFSASAIDQFERGYRSGRLAQAKGYVKIPDASWLCYGLTLAGLDSDGPPPF